MGLKNFSLSPRKLLAWASGATRRMIGGPNRAAETRTTTSPPETLVKGIKCGHQRQAVRRRRRPRRRTSVLLLSVFLLITIGFELVLCQQRRQPPPPPTGDATVIKATRAILAGGERAPNANKTPKLSVRSGLQQQQHGDNDKRVHDLRWPGRRLNVLVDRKSLNDTEQAMLASVLQQIERKTCVRVHRLPSDRVNPFAVSTMEQLDETERHFIYVFKSTGRNGDLIFGRPPSMGLSSLGCVKQGRQSVVLTELAFKWPELVLRYHVMRSLGVDNLERPDGQIRRLLNMLPLNQKIANAELLATIETRPQASKQSAELHATAPDSSSPGGLARWSSAALFEPPNLVARGPVTRNVPAYGSVRSVQLDASNARPGYLSDGDLEKIKELYDCKDYQNRLSPIPLANEIPSETRGEFGAEAPRADAEAAASGELNPKKFKLNDESDGVDTADKVPSEPPGAAQSESSSGERSPELSQEAAKRIVDSLLNNLDELQEGEKSNHQPAPDSIPSKSNGGGECKPLESCPLSTEGNETPNHGGEPAHHDEHDDTPLRQPPPQQQERPMILKLDEFHAQDPQLKQANQMKLSQLSNDTLETYRLMNNPMNLADFLQPAQSQSDDSHQRQIQPHEQLQADMMQSVNHWQKPKSEMLISFEQSNNQQGDPVSALAGSQVLKLCSCTCQTMTPKAPATLPPPPPPSPPPSVSPTTTTTTTSTTPASVPTTWPDTTPEPASPQTTFRPEPSERPTFSTDSGPPRCDDYDGDYDECHSPATPTESSWTEAPPVTSTPSLPPEPATLEPITIPPITITTLAPPPSPPPPPPPPPTTTTTTTTTTTPAPTTTTTTTTTRSPPTTSEPVTLPTTNEQTPASASITEAHTEPIPTGGVDNSTLTSTTSAADSSGGGGLLTASACDLVEWVRPNKTIYNSPRIVWDVDRANQNYFLCNNQLEGELIPGKTHGFYCKISHEGKAFEAHNFSVLTKPEHVNLAWVQKNSNSFGRTNFPVVGGYSKQQDPYIVSRCLVKDENNDIITLIGYINNQGVGWFPFDDIQIECSQYDVLACVN